MRFVSLLAALVLATPAIAQDGAKTEQPKERQICRMVQETGTILGGKKECHTKAEWARISDRDRTDRENRQRTNPGGFAGTGTAGD